MFIKVSGIDVGNGYTKFNGGRFLSKVEVGLLEEPTGEIHSVRFRGMDYMVGSPNGATVLERNKYFTENYLILLLTGIALSKVNTTGEVHAKITIGVPADQYKKEVREKIANHLIGTKEYITVDGKQYEIYIDDVIVFMEGSSVFKTGDMGKVLVVDVGNGTINIVLWRDGRKVSSYTFPKSISSLQGEMAEILGTKYNFTITPDKAEEYVGAERLFIDTGWVEVPELQKLLENLVTTCAGAIQRNQKLEVQSCEKVLIIGGGAEKTFQHFQKHFPQAVMCEDYQHMNQQVYEAIAEAKFVR